MNMRTLIVADRVAWSYWSIAQALVKHNTDPDLEINVMALKGNEKEFRQRERGYHRVLIMGHQMLDLLPWYTQIDSDRWLTGVHSHHGFDRARETTPEHDADPPWELLRNLKKFRSINAVSIRLHRLFSGRGLAVHYTPNGVDVETFCPTGPLLKPKRLVVGTAYSGKHDWRKGVTTIIRPACQEAGAELVEAKSRSDQYVAPEDMPRWYRQLSVYCCMSTSEGFSIAVLEAAASGIPVISTRVGGSTELIRDGIDGLLVDRSVPALVSALRQLDANRDQLDRMGQSIRKHTGRDFSWPVISGSWYGFLQA